MSSNEGAFLTMAASSPLVTRNGAAHVHGSSKCTAPDKPLITIIISTFNAAEHLRNLIKSIREQAYGNFEWIVVGGATTDGTVEVLQQNEGVIDCWISEPDKGIYDAWYKGLRIPPYPFEI